MMNGKLNFVVCGKRGRTPFIFKGDGVYGITFIARPDISLLLS